MAKEVIEPLTELQKAEVADEILPGILVFLDKLLSREHVSDEVEAFRQGYVAILQCCSTESPQVLRKNVDSLADSSLKYEAGAKSGKFGRIREKRLINIRQAHVGTDCEGAPVTCRYCKSEILRKDIEQHEVTCEEVPATCESQVVGCPRTGNLKRKELRQHANDGLIARVRFMLQYILTFVSQLSNYIPRPEFAGILEKVRNDITEIRTGLAEKFVMVVGKLTGLERRVESWESSDGGSDIIGMRNEVEELKSKLRDLTVERGNLRERTMRLEREVRDKVAVIDRLRSRMDQMDESLALNTVRTDDLENPRGPQQVIHSHNGTLLWKIESYQRKRQDAINGVKTALYSPPFYSAQYGYKMCAKVYMNGDGFGKGSHLSLFFVVMKGDYDAIQTWPFQKKITMMLLDQGNGDHMIDAFNSDPQSSSFQRPKSDMNIASGSPLFMPLDSLNNRQYIKDDVMFIKVIVD